jgi:hypothetical protein
MLAGRGFSPPSSIGIQRRRAFEDEAAVGVSKYPRVYGSLSESHLVIIVQGFKIASVDTAPRVFVTQADSVIEIAHPDDGVMIVNGSIPLKS